MTITVAETWGVFQGTFQLPELDQPPFVVNDRVSAAIVVGPGSNVYVDDFVIEELKPEPNRERKEP